MLKPLQRSVHDRLRDPPDPAKVAIGPSCLAIANPCCGRSQTRHSTSHSASESVGSSVAAMAQGYDPDASRAGVARSSMLT